MLDVITFKNYYFEDNCIYCRGRNSVHKACLALRLAFSKDPYVLETIVFAIVMAYSNESFLTVSSAGF